jgi:hypothetical protein
MYFEAGGRQYEKRMDMLVEMREERKGKKKNRGTERRS